VAFRHGLSLEHFRKWCSPGFYWHPTLSAGKNGKDGVRGGCSEETGEISRRYRDLPHGVVLSFRFSYEMEQKASGALRSFGDFWIRLHSFPGKNGLAIEFARPEE